MIDSHPFSPVISRQAPQRLARLGPGHWFVDFGRAVFGTVELTAAADAAAHEVHLHLGEKLSAPHRVDRSPPGCIRYRETKIVLGRATARHRAEITPDARNTGRRAVPMPPGIGEVLPFRYCEIENFPGVLRAEDIRQTFVHAPFNDDAAHFESSDPILDDVWHLCRHTIKATTFCGVYIDGDRERIPYEGDAYINQLSHYCLDADYRIGRATLEWLAERSTWPTDWHLHLPLVAWNQFLYSGDDTFLRSRYDCLKTKTLLALAEPNGLISTLTGKITPELKRALGLDDFFAHKDVADMVDWPRPGFPRPQTPGETDGYVFTPFNTVINALHYRALVLMRRIAGHLGNERDAGFFQGRAELVAASINRHFLDPRRGLYVDGSDTDHASLHANFFPMMAGLVPQERIATVAAFVKSRGMACSVYGAQHLLDGLYRAGEDKHALSLLTARSDRSWFHMSRRLGSTMTLEAWDYPYKQNLDWNHAWGAAPTNLIVRRLLGVRPLSPGCHRMRVAPQPGGLEWCRARIPTPHGPIELELWNEDNQPLRLSVSAPDAIEAVVEVKPTTVAG